MLLTIVFFPSGLAHSAEQIPPKTELHVWHQWREEKQEILDRIIEDFNCQSEDTRVIADPLGPVSGSVAEKMLPGPAVVEQPDLALVERNAIPILADAGVIRPLDKLLESSEFLQKANLFESAQRYGTFKGKLYGLPVALNPYVLIYDSALLSRAGVSLPTSWDDFIKLSQTQGESGSKSSREQWVLNVRSTAAVFNILCVQNGINPAATKVSPEHTIAISKMLRLLHQFRQSRWLMPPQYKFWDPNFVNVTSNKLFFQIDDPAMVAHLMETSSVSLSVAMPPCDSTPIRTLLGNSFVFVVSRSSTHGRQLIKFLEFFYSSRQYSRFSEKLLFVSPLKTARKDVTVLSKAPIYSQLVSAAEHAGALPLGSNTGKSLSEIARIVEKMDSGLITPERALDDILEAGKQETSERHAPPQPTVRVTWAESTQRLYATDVSNFSNAPVEIVSSRNEHETFQLALATEEPMNGLRAKIGPFVSEEGYPYQLKAGYYVETDTLISTPLVSQRAGLYPNVLDKAGQFNIVPGELTRLWVDIFVPESIPAGILSSEIIIERDGSTVAQIPVHVLVLPLSIPASPSQPAVIGLNYELIAKHYGLRPGSKAYWELMDSFYWFMVEHRMSPYEPPVPIDSPKVGTYLRDKRVSACRIPYPPEDPRFKKVVRLAENGDWLDKLFVYFIDEPTYYQYKAIIEIGGKIHSAKVFPRFLVTCFPDRLLIGSVDIWCIHMPFLPVGIPHSFAGRKQYIDAVNERLAAGDAVWWYTAGAVKPFPTLQIEDDPAAFRIIPWLQQMYRIGGFLQWEAANWSQPFDEPLVKYFGNGEGTLVYPGERKPSPSIRLELLREGMEDMECLMLLRRNLANVQKLLRAEWLGEVTTIRIGEICRRLISDEALREHGVTDVFLLPHVTREPGAIELVRREVLEEIMGLQSQPLALVLTEPMEKLYTDLDSVRIYGAVKPGSKIRINGQKQTVDGRGGGFSGNFSLSSGTNIFCIRIENGQRSKTIIRKIEKY